MIVCSSWRKTRVLSDFSTNSISKCTAFALFSNVCIARLIACFIACKRFRFFVIIVCSSWRKTREWGKQTFVQSICMQKVACLLICVPACLQAQTCPKLLCALQTCPKDCRSDAYKSTKFLKLRYCDQTDLSGKVCVICIQTFACLPSFELCLNITKCLNIFKCVMYILECLQLPWHASMLYFQMYALLGFNQRSWWPCDFFR